MTIVKELNELAERMTGTNPKATTDAQAMNYIEQNYNGGGSSGGNANIVDIDLGTEFLQRYFVDPTNYGKIISITNEEDLALLREMISYADQYSNTIFRILVNFGGMQQMVYGLPVISYGTLTGIDFSGFMMGDNVTMFYAHIEGGPTNFAIRPYIVILSSGQE